MYRFANTTIYAERPYIKGNAWMLTGNQGELQHFEQITLGDGSRIRFFCNGMDAATRTLTGTLLMPKLTKKEEDYARFKNLTDRLCELTQVAIPNFQERYLSFLKKPFTDLQSVSNARDIQEGQKYGLTDFILNTSHIIHPDDASLQRSKALGYLGSCGLYLAGIGFQIYQGGTYPEISSKTILAICGDFVSALIITKGEMLLSTSVVFAIISQLISNNRRIKKNNNLWEQAKGIEDTEKAIKEIDGLIAQIKIPCSTLDVLENQKSEQEQEGRRLNKILQEEFEHTKYMPGLSITFKSTSKDYLLDVFNYLLSDGTAPKPNPQQIPTDSTTGIDPWCELTEPEQKTVDPWCKLESVIQNV